MKLYGHRGVDALNRLVGRNTCRSFLCSFFCLKLKYGYFSLPVTWEEVFPGRMDMPMTVEEMKAVDIRTVDRDTLVDIRDVKIDRSLPLEERVRSFVEQIKNPYCFRCGDAVVKTSFLDTDVTLEDCVESYLRNL